MARIFLKSLSKSDHVCRIVGDEFPIFIYDLNRQVINDIMSMILDQLGEFIRDSTEYSSLNLGISIGIAELYRNEPTKVVMQRADDACYQAKRKGKNCYF